MFRRSPLSYSRYRRSVAKLCYVVFLIVAIAFWNLCDTILDPMRPYPAMNHSSSLADERGATNYDFAIRQPLVPASNEDVTGSGSHHQTIRSLNFVRDSRPQADTRSTSRTDNGDHYDVEPHYRNDGHTHEPTPESRVARKNAQNVMGEEHKHSGDDTMIPIRQVPVEQELPETTEKGSLPEATDSLDDVPVGNYRFPSQDECQSLKDKADTLSDMLVVTFEDAIQDMVLEGWEDDWISKARYTGPKLNEPKIDFVYNCMYIPIIP
jgi:hypothetical protein